MACRWYTLLCKAGWYLFRWIVWTPLTLKWIPYSSLFSLYLLPCLHERSTPAFSNKEDFILRLRTRLEPGDPPGMEGTLVIGIDPQLSYELLSLSLLGTPLTSSCLILFLFSTSKLLLPYNIGLPRHSMALHYLMVLFSPPPPTTNGPILLSVYISVSWLKYWEVECHPQFIILYQNQFSCPTLAQSPLVVRGWGLSNLTSPSMLQWTLVDRSCDWHYQYGQSLSPRQRNIQEDYRLSFQPDDCD